MAGSADSGLTILIAEDNKVNMTLVKIVIKGRFPQARIVEAVNGKEAVERFREEKPGLILMDVQMPVMNGYDATRQIRELEQESGGHTPIIALTAGTMDEERSECMNVGMDDFVSKPIINDSLFSVIDHWLGN